jgi:hypothetical protein
MSGDVIEKQLILAFSPHAAGFKLQIQTARLTGSCCLYWHFFCLHEAKVLEGEDRHEDALDKVRLAEDPD